MILSVTASADSPLSIAIWIVILSGSKISSLLLIDTVSAELIIQMNYSTLDNHGTPIKPQFMETVNEP
jgi:hypothetical protein